MTQSVLDALLDWLTDHHSRGGDYSPEAVQAAGEAAVAAELIGLSPDQSFEAGRAAYFGALGRVPDRSNVRL